MTERELVERDLRASFGATIERRVDRQLHSNVHPIICSDFFSEASSECREMYVAGHYYGCISLVQSVAEGLAKFIAGKNNLASKYSRDKSGVYQEERVGKLVEAGFISANLEKAFMAIVGTDRDQIHHMNRNVETDNEKLEARAREVLCALYEIESEIFAYTNTPGEGITPLNPQYWPKPDDDGIAVVRIRT
jgi:hypothetical protein